MDHHFGAFSSAFSVSQKLSLKMDLPSGRETVLHFFDRVRQELPDMDRFKRFSGELVLESGNQGESSKWLSLRRQSVQSNVLMPSDLSAAYRLHELVLDVCPYYLTISPLDVDAVELVFGFEIECKTNQNQVIYDAFYAGTPLAALAEGDTDRLVDVQPVIGTLAQDDDRVSVFYDISTSTTSGQVRKDRYRTEPINVALVLKQSGPVDSVDQMGEISRKLAQLGERLVEHKLIPHVLGPINRQIIGSS